MTTDRTAPRTAAALLTALALTTGLAVAVPTPAQAAPATLAAAPAAAASAASPGWAWTRTALPATRGHDQRVQVAMRGLTARRAGAVLLRRTGGTFVEVRFASTRYQVSLVRSGRRSVAVDLPLAAGPAGTARAEVVGDTVRGYWNGRLVRSSRLAAVRGLPGRGTGLAVWQERPAAVQLTGPAVTAPGTSSTSRSAALRMFGRPRSGLSWHSGFWAGGVASAGRIAAAGAWRGTPMDVATTYGNYGTWAEMATSEWNITTFAGFPGRLAYGLPLLPRNRAGHWEDILSGANDEVFATVARQLVKAGRGTSVVRVGWEANGTWYPWAVTARSAPRFRAAVRRVVSVMKAQAPHLTFWLDLAAGTALSGQTSRLDPLTRLYPGDGVLDGVSMDHYDQWNTRARTAGAFTRSMRPGVAAGLADAASFARAHRIGFAVPEWGLNRVHGSGDNPLFVDRMFAFFTANRDVLVFESYFNEADPYIANALWGAPQNPRSAAIYRRLW